MIILLVMLADCFISNQFVSALYASQGQGFLSFLLFGSSLHYTKIFSQCIWLTQGIWYSTVVNSLDSAGLDWISLAPELNMAALFSSWNLPSVTFIRSYPLTPSRLGHSGTIIHFLQLLALSASMLLFVLFFLLH